MRAGIAALPSLRSGYAARSNNVAIWRPARPLHLWMPSLWRVAHRTCALRVDDGRAPIRRM